VQSVLLDAGALVAILNRNDRHHADLIKLLQGFDGRLFTTWPVISEACALVSERAQVRALDWIAEAGVEIVSIDAGLEFMRQQMIDYGDLPCDFADASLLYAVWSTKIRDVWTIDSDFAVYRLPDRSRFKVSPSR
jgi:predicted nucleic acid-binding protein